MNTIGSKTAHLELVRTELQKCSKCGECTSVCPVYRETREEKFVARGKLALAEAVLSHKLPMTDEFYDVLNNCILCLSCVEKCPSGVRVDKIVSCTRYDLIADRGLPLYKQFLFSMLRAGRHGVDFFFRSGSLAQRVLFRRIPDNSGLKRRFPMPVFDGERYVPHFARHPFRCYSPEFLPAPQRRKTVLFFTGCCANYIYTGIAEDTIYTLNALGIDVIVPRDQACCGAPVHASGDLNTSLVLARRNIEALDTRWRNFDIVTVCSSGGHMLKTKYTELLENNAEYFTMAKNVSRRTFDISEYLIHKIGASRIQKRLQRRWSQKTTYHDPCHLRKGQGVFEEPRELIKIVAGDRFVELANAEACCGSGGFYGLAHKETSLKILSKKTDRIVEIGADAVVTGCPGCIIQLKDGLRRKEKTTQVFHIIEILAQCL